MNYVCRLDPRSKRMSTLQESLKTFYLLFPLHLCQILFGRCAQVGSCIELGDSNVKHYGGSPASRSRGHLHLPSTVQVMLLVLDFSPTQLPCYLSVYFLCPHWASSTISAPPLSVSSSCRAPALVLPPTLSYC